jgi:hypothetical protein
MLGVSIIGRVYGTEACLIALAIIIVLGLWLLRMLPIPMAPMSDRPEPLALGGDDPPPLSGPGAQARIGAISRPSLSANPPERIYPAVSDRGGSDSHRAPVARR